MLTPGQIASQTLQKNVDLVMSFSQGTVPMLRLMGKLARTRAWTERETAPQWKQAWPEEEPRSVEVLTVDPVASDGEAAPMAGSPATARGKEDDIYEVEKIRAIFMREKWSFAL
jgi:hypothetical protein